MRVRGGGKHSINLLNEFWARWRKEYLLIQQTRSKWNTPSRNISVGDIVILRDDGIRGHWILAKVIETIVDADNLVRRVKLLIGTSDLTKDGIFHIFYCYVDICVYFKLKVRKSNMILVGSVTAAL